MRLVELQPWWVLLGLLVACAAHPVCPIATPMEPGPPPKPRIRHNGQKEADPPECSVDEDCPRGDHVVASCDGFRRCAHSCEDHWGDCNDDMTDGCESSIKHRYLCDGDPRIDFYSPPSAMTEVRELDDSAVADEHLGFYYALERYVPWIEQCQKEVLRTNPDTEAEIEYEVTIDDDGVVIGHRPREATASTSPLASCVECLLSDLDFGRPRGSFSKTFLIRVLFLPGSYPYREEME